MPLKDNDGVAGACQGLREADAHHHLASRNGGASTLTRNDGLALSRLTSASDVAAHLLSLRTLLQSCVNEDPAMSSIGFMAPLSDAEADEYWNSIGSKLEEAQPTVYLFVATSPKNDTAKPGETDVLGTIQIHTIPKANQAHRAEVAKLLVRPSARRMGLATKLMALVEAFAKHTLGKKVLILDTMSTTPARDFYLRAGWVEWGQCPGWATFADGTLGTTAFFHRFLE